MWHSQRMDIGAEFDDEVARSSSAILQIGENMIQKAGLQLRFMVFALFLAGVASSGSDKRRALDLIIAIEKEAVGRNTIITRNLLQIVYDRQTEQFMNEGHSHGVDWIDVMIEQGLQVVNFGM
jgi:hypothetical protein